MAPCDLLSGFVGAAVPVAVDTVGLVVFCPPFQFVVGYSHRFLLSGQRFGGSLRYPAGQRRVGSVEGMGVGVGAVAVAEVFC